MLILSTPTVSAQSPIRIAIGDVPGVDTLVLLAAVERARARGQSLKVSYLQSEDITVRAVLEGEVDIGIGTPYQAIQSEARDLRMFYQLRALRFYPVVNTDYYKGWKDLDDAIVFVHSPGSGTEAIMKMMAKREGIRYAEIRYLPGSGVRARAMLKGRIRATMLDGQRRTQVLEAGGGKFALLPLPEMVASDEALYARRKLIRARRADISVLIEELLAVSREVNADPSAILSIRKELELLPELPSEDQAMILPVYEELVQSGAMSNNGGGSDAIAADLEFYAIAGALDNTSGSLRAEDYWDLEPLNGALDRLGRR